MLGGTIGAVLEETVQDSPDSIALKDDQGELSFAELHEQVLLASAALATLGVHHGDHFAIWAPNSVKWIIAALGGMLRGAVMVPINTRLKGHETADILNRVKAKTVFTVGDFLGSNYFNTLRKENLPYAKNCIDLGDSQDVAWSDFLTLGRSYSGAKLEKDLAKVSPDDLSDIIFTSGTSGKPKGVVTSHAQTTGNAKAWGDAVGLRAGDKYLCVNPFFHTFGFKAGWLPCLIAKATMIPQPTFDLARVYEIIKQERVTVFPGPPTIFEDMLAAPAKIKRDTSSLRTSVTGAAVVPEDLIGKMKTELDIDNVISAYGLTEACGTATASGKDDPVEIAANTVGAPVDGVEIRIVDKNGDAAAQDEHGEVLLKSAYNFLFYLDDPLATEAAYTKDGWMRTGDIGAINKRGYLKITGRKKEMFIVGGFNCYPAEIEFMLAKHADIAEVAVIGIPDTRLGEVGAAFIVKESGCNLTEASVIEWARNHMANYKAPRKVLFMDTLPRTALGKVRKEELKKLIAVA